MCFKCTWVKEEGDTRPCKQEVSLCKRVPEEMGLRSLKCPQCFWQPNGIPKTEKLNTNTNHNTNTKPNTNTNSNHTKPNIKYQY